MPRVDTQSGRLFAGAWDISVIALVGFLLRLYRIDHQSVWYDEAFSLTTSRLPLHEMNGRIIETSWDHPPLHYYLLHLWFQVAGFGPFQARLLSAIFGTLAIVLIYGLARYLFDRRTALLAALLLSVSQLGVMYSQEARHYTKLLCFVLCSIYCFVVALREQRAAWWWAFVGSALLTIYTHYYGVFVVASLFLYAALFRSRYGLPLRWFVALAGLTVVCLSAWLATGVLARALQVKPVVLRNQPAWFAVDKWTVVSTLNDFNNGRFLGLLNRAPAWTYLVGMLLFTVPALLALKPLVTGSGGSGDRAEREGAALLTILWMAPVLLVIGMGAFNVQYDVRYVMFCIAPYYVLVARGIVQLPSRALRCVLVVLLLAYSAGALRANYFIPYKENYRDALAYLAREYRSGDCCIFLPFGGVPLEWSVYHDNHPALEVTNPDAVASGQARCERVWLTTYRRVPWAVLRDREGEGILAATHTNVTEVRYFWVNVALYVPRR